MVPVLSSSWSRRTLGLIAVALVAVVVASQWLRLASVGGPSANLPLGLLGAAALGGVFATIQTFRAKAHHSRRAP
jgi:hypothetical protein